MKLLSFAVFLDNFYFEKGWMAPENSLYYKRAEFKKAIELGYVKWAGNPIERKPGAKPYVILTPLGRLLKRKIQQHMAEFEFRDDDVFVEISPRMHADVVEQTVKGLMENINGR